jgi:hypothetical protein
LKKLSNKLACKNLCTGHIFSVFKFQNSPELSAHFYETDEAVKQKKLDLVMKETVPFYLEKFDEMAKDGYLANGKVNNLLITFIAKF